jgi:hypothetical protein
MFRVGQRRGPMYCYRPRTKTQPSFDPNPAFGLPKAVQIAECDGA